MRLTCRDIHHLGLDGYFDEYNFHDSLQAYLTVEVGLLLQFFFMFFFGSKRWLFRLEAVRCVLKDLWGRGANTRKNVYKSTAFQWRKGLQWTGTHQGMQQRGVSGQNIQLATVMFRNMTTSNHISLILLRNQRPKLHQS